MKKADAILAADLHLREDQPVCRTDDYFKAQARSVGFIKQLQKKHDCPLLISGDVFHHWKPSPFLLAWALENLPDKLVCVPGQHDLPRHSMELYYKSGLAVLEKAKKAYVITAPEHGMIYPRHTVCGAAYGEDLIPAQKPPELDMDMRMKRIYMAHVMTHKTKAPFPGCEADNATRLLKKLKYWNLILTGDNHETFTLKKDGRWLVNPGSVMRMRADQASHKPCVFLWWARTNKIEQVFLPISRRAISRDHIDEKQEKESRLEAWAEQLNKGCEIGLSFADNLKEHLAKNKVTKAVRKLIAEAME